LRFLQRWTYRCHNQELLDAHQHPTSLAASVGASVEIRLYDCIKSLRVQQHVFASLQGSKDGKRELAKLLHSVGQVKKLEVSLLKPNTRNDLDASYDCICIWLQLCTS